MDAIKKYADQKDLQALKFIFVDALDVDPTFEDYEEGYNYCKTCGILEPHQELTPLINDPSKWDKTYWRQLEKDILENLSEKRIDHMREVAKVVHKDKIKRILAEQAERAAAQARQQASVQASSPVQNHTPTTSSTRTASSSTTTINAKTEKQPPVRKTQPSITKEDIDKYNREQERIAAEKRAKEEIPTIKVESRKEDSNSKKALGIALTAAAVVATVVIVAIIVK